MFRLKFPQNVDKGILSIAHDQICQEHSMCEDILSFLTCVIEGLTLKPPIISVVTINRRVEQSVGLGRNSDQSTGEMDNRFFPIIACPLLSGHVRHMATHKHNKTVKQQS